MIRMAERGVMDSKVSSLLTYGAEQGIFPDFINAPHSGEKSRWDPVSCALTQSSYFYFVISMMNNWRQGSI